jgi:nicotinate dehydrogenase subunit B
VLPRTGTLSLRLGAKQRVRFDRFGVTSDTWETYPILRFSEVPALDVELVGDQRNPSLGVGEEEPTAAAIGNAVFDALGVRVRTLPFNAGEHCRGHA